MYTLLYHIRTLCNTKVLYIMVNQEEWMKRAPVLSTILGDTFDINEQRNDPVQLTNTTSEYYNPEDL